MGDVLLLWALVFVDRLRPDGTLNKRLACQKGFDVMDGTSRGGGTIELVGITEYGTAIITDCLLHTGWSKVYYVRTYAAEAVSEEKRAEEVNMSKCLVGVFGFSGQMRSSGQSETRWMSDIGTDIGMDPGVPRA